jgi:hypothetical protein
MPRKAFTLKLAAQLRLTQIPTADTLPLVDRPYRQR